MARNEREMGRESLTEKGGLAGNPSFVDRFLLQAAGDHQKFRKISL
jgi:hypothetical protein